MTAFECDTCVFRKLRDGQAPNPKSHADTVLLAYIRRMNLDAFWSRASSTVRSNARALENSIQSARRLRIIKREVPMGPLPSFDHCGYAVAIEMLEASLKPGKYSATNTQWDTIRKIPTAHSNLLRAGKEANSSHWAIVDSDGKSYRFMASDPMHSLWFQRFKRGCKDRMGQDWRPDQAVTPELMVPLLDWTKHQAMDATTEEDKTRWVSAGIYFAICFVLSLRGPEGLLLDLEGLWEHTQEIVGRFTMIVLRGRVKSERAERLHLLPCVNQTDSGINVASWVRQLLHCHAKARRTTGPALGHQDGSAMTSRDMNEMFHEGLAQVFEK